MIFDWSSVPSQHVRLCLHRTPIRDLVELIPEHLFGGLSSPLWGAGINCKSLELRRKLPPTQVLPGTAREAQIGIIERKIGQVGLHLDNAEGKQVDLFATSFHPPAFTVHSHYQAKSSASQTSLGFLLKMRKNTPNPPMKAMGEAV